jgi:CPA1 family monovalent cation:H+ antiporter
MLDTAAAFLVVTALLAYFNQRVLRLPTTIGVMVTSLALSLLILGLDTLGIAQGLHAREEAFVRSIDFSYVLMQGMLSLLLFAGALHVNFKALRSYRWQVTVLATVGTAVSTLVVGAVLWMALPVIGLKLPLLHCMLFGALISPTDPISVIAMLKSAGAPHDLEVVIAGESLFNDGVGVVIFSVLIGMVESGAAPDLQWGALSLLRQAGGGLLFGLILGYAVFYLLRGIENYQLEVLLTLAAVMGGYALASHLAVSGPLAMVVAGLVIGNDGRALAMSDQTRPRMDLFWELLDAMLNAMLFVLIGMEVLVIRFPASAFVASSAAALAVVATLAARWLTVGLPVLALRKTFRLPEGAALVLTWGGLRGGISIALALSLPSGTDREILIALTYYVVLFSVVCQGLTFKRVLRRSLVGQTTFEEPGGDRKNAWK